jgi:dihydrolipoamide dehydrogenase
MQNQTADVLVLGAGPGGYTAAFRAADLGKRVALVDREATLGGVCLNVGCIPSKALLHAAKVIAETREMSENGISFGPPSVDLDRLRAWKEGVVGRLTGGLATLARQRKVDVIRGYGRFTSPHSLAVDLAGGGVVSVEFEQAIIAAGSEAVTLPFMPVSDPRVMDSTGALEIAEVPRRLLVIGGGIIGLEMATVYHELGAKITVVELLDQLIPGVDRDVITPLAKRVGRLYENVYLKTSVTGVEAGASGLTVAFEGPKAPATDTFDRILVAVGRRPNGLMIEAERAGVTVDPDGFIAVNKQMRTNVPHIFAVGDVVGQPMLAHKAMHEAKVAAEVAAGKNSFFDVRAIPSVAYTDPEVAWAGATENEARAAGVAYGKGAFPWAASGRSLTLGRSEGLTKVLFDETTGRVIGCGIVGPSAGDLIAEAVLAIEMGADAADIALSIHPHPTLSETVALAAEAFEGTITDLYLPRRLRYLGSRHQGQAGSDVEDHPGAERAFQRDPGGAGYPDGRAGYVAGFFLYPRTDHYRSGALVAVGAPGRVAGAAEELDRKRAAVPGDRGEFGHPRRVPARGRDRAVTGQDHERAGRDGHLAHRPAKPGHREAPGGHARRTPAGQDGHRGGLRAGHGKLAARVGTAAGTLRGEFGERGPGGQQRQPYRGAVAPADQAGERLGGQRAGQPEVPGPEGVLLLLAGESFVARYGNQFGRIQQDQAGSPGTRGPRPVPLRGHLPGSGLEGGRGPGLAVLAGARRCTAGGERRRGEGGGEDRRGARDSRPHHGSRGLDAL